MKYSKEEKAMWLEDWKQSGKKAWAYARENGIIPQTFCSWVKSEAKQAPGFVELPTNKKPKLEQVQEILVEKGDIKIHIPISVWIECPGIIMEGLKAMP
jgi:transposase-like protein